MAITAETYRAQVDTYWLEHCEGFRVDSPGGRVGLVGEVLRSVSALAVFAGALGRRVLIVPFDDVVEVEPRCRRLELTSSPTILATMSTREWERSPDPV